MFEALIKDPTILEITIVLVVLLAIAFWQNLKQFAAILGGIYFIYIIFIISSYENNLEPQIIEEKIPDVIDNQIDSVITENNVVFEDDTSKKVIDLVKDDQSIKKLELIPNSISNNPQPINVLNLSLIHI